MTRYGAQVRAFCMDGERGNDAFVFSTEANEPVDIDACIATANRLQSEVTWIRRGATSHDLQLRFFTPGGEIAFCGHGTLAAAAWLSSRSREESTWVFDIDGAPVCVERDASGRWSYLQEEGGSQPVGDDALIEALRSLYLPNADGRYVAGAKLARSIGAPREKLLLELPNAVGLRHIAIDASRRDALCERLNTTGLYVFSVCDERPPRIVARHFPLRCDTQEDMATAGIAPTVVRHVGLSTVLGDIIIEQGGPDCGNARLVVSPANEGTARRVGGECVIGREMQLGDPVARTP